MISFEHGEIRKSDEQQLAGMIAHGVVEPGAARAVSFLNGATRLTLAEWSAIVSDEVARRRARKKELERAVRRVRYALMEHSEAPIHRWLLSYTHEIAFDIKRRCEVEPAKTHSTVTGMLTACSFAILYGETIGEPQLALVYAPFDPYIPLSSLG